MTEDQLKQIDIDRRVIKFNHMNQQGCFFILHNFDSIISKVSP